MARQCGEALIGCQYRAGNGRWTRATVDWDKVRSEAATAVLNSAHGMAFRAVFQKDGIDAMVRELQMMQRRTRTNNEAFQEKQRDVSRKASKEIEAPLRPSQDPRRSVSPR